MPLVASTRWAHEQGVPTPSQIQQALAQHLVDEILLRDEPLAEDEDLFEAGFDSMSLSRLLVFIEDRFGVSIPDEDVVIDDITTLTALTAFVAGYLK